MTSPAVEPAAGRTTMAVLDGGASYEIFDVLELVDDVVRAHTPFLLEIGEELAVRIEHGGEAFEARARVRAHLGPPTMRITELELSARTAVRANTAAAPARDRG